MSKITINQINKGQIFWNGKDRVYEIESFCKTNTAFYLIQAVVHRVIEGGKFERMANENVTLEMLRALPNRPEYNRLRSYNQCNFGAYFPNSQIFNILRRQ